MRIISGGQTGVDRAGLDVALKHEIECGGWVAAGRCDELGRIPEQYPVWELEHGSFPDRTWQNVKDSDGTVIFHSGSLSGGSEDTVRFCIEQNRPHLVIDAQKIPGAAAAHLIGGFVRRRSIETLNVAGPRLSEWTGGYEYAFRALDLYFSESGK